VQDEIRRRAGYVLRAPGPATAEGLAWFKTPAGMVSLTLLSVVPLAGLAFGVRSLAKRRRFRQRSRFASGESPATAIEAAAGEDLGARVEGLRCACGARYRQGSAAAANGVKYDGRTLLVWAVTCEECRQRRSVFFAVGGDAAGDGK